MKRAGYIIAAILLVLVVTNPSIREFESHEKGGHANASEFGRIHNYFICSIYQSNNADYRRKYFAILGNFYEINTRKLYNPNKSILE
ncbi:hypothetical protein [Mucilaginibacter lacusdianchii]|uniref:hypothetical protein n=1 Tax=Mucilaginibacter lacusdianchii TaxID=2684211 RepID=UPI00131C8E84|nr:hypothetical protein [Mucilaginibacter sp. JXJ CY 39]